MSLYHHNGYLNVPWINDICDKNNISFIVIVGNRQIGKTYGTLKFMLDSDKRFILMRRTQTEVDFLCNMSLNPFSKINPFIVIKKDSEYTARIDNDEDDESVQIGLVTSLKGIAKIRGFSGDIFTDLVFDEFIPENHVTRIKDEGDAFINAVITISGNRELEGRPPLRCWMLANANNINNPILQVLGVQIKLNTLINKGQEYSILKDRGIMLINAKAESIIEKRKQTAISKVIDINSKVAKMAFQNEFSYNDQEHIKSVDLKNYTPKCSVLGQFSMWKSKQNNTYFVDDYRRTSLEFNGNQRGKREFLRHYPEIKIQYYNNRFYFRNLIIKENFKSFIDVQ